MDLTARKERGTRTGVEFKDLGAAGNFVGQCAAIIGGALTIWGAVKARTYAVRLCPVVESTLIPAGDGTYLRIAVSLKNSGNSRVHLKRDLSKVHVEAGVGKYDAADVVEWEHLRWVDVLQEHQYLESGEEIRDEQILKLPEGESIYRIEFGVTTQGVPSVRDGQLGWFGKRWRDVRTVRCE